MCQVPRISRRTRIEVREHRCDCFAQDNRPGSLHALDGTRILGRHKIVEKLGTRSRAEPFRIEEVFDTDRNAVKRAPELFSARLLFASPGFCQDPLAIDCHPRPNSWLDPVDSRQQSLDVVDWR